MNPARLLDVLAAAFGRVLRTSGVSASPAEVVEVRRVLALLGAADLDALRSGLRAVTVKYDHERPGFERAFDAFFGAAAGGARRGAAVPSPQAGAEGLPTGLELADGDDPLARYADHNPRAAEVGDLVDAPEQERGFNPHRDDVSLAGSDADLSVSSGEDQGRRGVSYTLDLERAGSAVAKELTSARSAPVAGSVDWDDPAAVLAWLAAYDPHAVYADGPGGPDRLDAAQLNVLVDAVAAFVEELALRTGPTEHPSPETDAGSAADPADLQRACHELLRRMRGAPRRVAREHSHGPLDVRHTVRRSMRTDGVPFHLVQRPTRPDRVRLLVIADVSLSVRSITAFALRLAQTLHAMAFRCRVLAYVDRAVDVTDTLLRTRGDDALAAVLAAPGLDLDATSNYGRVLESIITEHGSSVDRRTAVLFVGDGRCNGLPTGAEHLRRLRRRAHRIGWVTPEPRRYWTQVSCALPEYAQIVDHVVVARDAAELAGQAGELGHALS